MARLVRPKGFVALAVAATAMLAALVAGAGSSSASTPPSQTVTAPPPPGITTVTWTGTIPPGVNATSDCNAPDPNDEHTIELQIPAGFYDTATSSATFTISWGNPNNDEILTVNAPDGSEVGSSDGSGASEVVSASDLEGGEYQVLACGFAAPTSQNYTGELTFATMERGSDTSLPSADAQGLSFSASVPADPQRDEAEPLINIDADGNSYTCGPTGFSGASDYAQVSTDGGDQFHLLGEEPRGQQGLGGGGDCGLASGVKRNSDGNFQYAYAGLGPLTGFTTSTSADDGHNIDNAGPQGNTNTAEGGLADRQWLTFLDDHTVLLNYNQQVPRNIVVQKSTDGGLTYLPGNDAISSPNPDFPGPMGSMPATLVDPSANPDDYVAYYGWNASDNDNSYVNFAISEPDGLTWHNCRVQSIPVDETGGLGFFTVADNDSQGNIYLTYADRKGYHSYLTTLTADKLQACDGDNMTDAADLTDPGWSDPVQVDRDNVRSTVFPWLAAGGEPGRVAIAFYGTETDGDPNGGDFKASWDVYVNQSLNALDQDPAISQVKATTHPFHYDSICLRGLACDVSQPPGDRSLADFFAIDYNPRDGRLSVVYNQGAKKPDEPAGHVATPAVFTQQAGPSNGGGTVSPRHQGVSESSSDPGDDAIADYSSLFPGGPPSNPRNVPAMDFLSQSVGQQTDLETGAAVADGGFDVTLRLADLSDPALQQALSDTKSASLLYIFRFVNGYQAAAAVARWSPLNGFTFGYNDYTTDSVGCGSSGEKCQLYPGDQPLEGAVDQDAGTITLSVPRSYLRGLSGDTGPFERPAIVKAEPGTRFYDATAFSLGNTSADPGRSSFLYPIDNPPAMDFLLPGSPGAGEGTGGGGGDGSGAGSCSNEIKGSAKKDKLEGTDGSDRISGDKGADKISGRGGGDCLSGQRGRDRVAGDSGDDRVRGSRGTDKVKGGRGDDRVTGGRGRDRVSGGRGKDQVKGGRGHDKLKGGRGNDVIHTRRGGRDRVNCGRGKDKVFYSPHKDTLRHCEIKKRK